MVPLKLATADDLKRVCGHKFKSGGERVKVYEMKYGQKYRLKSIYTGKFDEKLYEIEQHTDPKDLALWLENEMIYIPINK